MRFLFGLSIVALAACSGASSSELFGESPRVGTDDPSSTEPPVAEPASPEDDTSPAGTTPKDAGVKRDAAPDAQRDAHLDAQPDVVVLVPDASLPEKCSFDSECTVEGDVCNWKTDICAAPGPIGAPCKRDLECTNALCNWKLTMCSAPAPAGTPCRRHKECASGVCSATSLCE
jgi:hypothetical protein